VIPLVDLIAQQRSILDELQTAVSSVVASGTYVLGEEVEAFEREFAAYCGTRYAIGVNSGTSALHLALIVAGVGPGDEVITVADTFIATIEAIRYTGATPVFVDTDPWLHTMDPLQLESVISARTKAVVPVHLYGQCADMGAINRVCWRYGIRVIEDAAQAHGARYKGRRAGGLGDIGCFSFYPTKNLGAYGEAGAIVTDDEDLALTARQLRDHGQSRKYAHDHIGYNYRMDAIQGAVLRVKLKHLDGWNDARRQRAARYRELLTELPVQAPEVGPASEHVYHIFAVMARDRDSLLAHLKEKAIQAAVHYPVPVHLQLACKDLGYKQGQLPNTERHAANTLSLPMYPELSDGQLVEVVDEVRAFMEVYAV
jgi:dTDP-4-amino-4,6-dideoxygalactose transaminase